MSLYLAIDAGGTNTTCVLADDRTILARTQTGSIKRMRVSAEEASRNLSEALDALEYSSGIKIASVDAVCIGTAGETVDLVVDWIDSEIRRSAPHAKLLILGDVEIALEAAFPGTRGVLALAGTGSNICGRTASGRTFRAGGYGPVIADQGSGYWIGREGLRAAFLATDRGEYTLLMDAIAAAWGLTTAEQIIAFAHTTPPPDLSRLSRIVTNCADEGDAVARSVLERGGQDLGELVRMVLRRIRQSEAEEGKEQGTMPGVAVAGSILQHVTTVREAMIASLCELGEDIEVKTDAIDPVLGALWRARQMMNA